MIIRKNDSFVNDNGELVVINGKHFNVYAVSVYHYNDDTEEYDIFDRYTFYTTYYVRKIANAKEITWSDEN